MEVPAYLKDGPNLSDAEAAQLAALAQAGDADARERMARCHIRLASRMARATRTRYLPVDERFQEALIILDRCTMKFDVRENVPFRVYAANQIRLRIMKAIEKERRAEAERNPPPLTERQEQVLTLRQRGLSCREVAEEMDLTVDVVEDEGSRSNEAFAAEALLPDRVRMRQGTRISSAGRRGRRLALFLDTTHGAEGEAGDLNRLLKRARAAGTMTETQEQVVRLRATGSIFPEIARALGISRKSAAEGFQRARRALTEAARNADR